MTEDRGHLPTERPNEATADLDTLDALAAVDLVTREEAHVQTAIEAARTQIAAAVERVADALASGGRLIYVGAGTSGRLAALDAAECPPTFSTPPEMVQAILAGGPNAWLRAEEGAEDSRAGGKQAVAEREVGPLDVVFGITAGGTTPFVHAALAEARSRGAGTIFFACVSADAVPDEADLTIRVLTGPEVLAGSTRLKAGTATKRVLNMITTLSMARLGKIHGNLMVDVNTRSNQKLVDRGERLVETLTGASRETAARLLQDAHGEVKTAVVMGSRGDAPSVARARIKDCAGSLRRALK